MVRIELKQLLAGALLALTLPFAAHAGDAHISAAPQAENVNNWDANPFTLKYADGRTLSSDSLRGKMVFIDAWATWCPPCMPSLPKFAEIYEKNLGNPYVKAISVHLSDRYGRFDNAGAFLRSKGLYYPVLQDPDATLIENLDVVPITTAVPHYVLLDGTGKIIRRYGEINDKVIMDVQNNFDSHSKAMRSNARLANSSQNP